MAGRELVWITPDGEEFLLTDRATGYRVTKGATGLGMPAVELTLDETPLLDGADVSDVYAPPRPIQLPILILASDVAGYRERVLALVHAVSYGQQCHLEVRQADGQRRRIPVWYSGGLEGAEDKDTGGETWMRLVLKALAPMPFWFDPVPIVYRYEYSSGTPPVFLGDPFLPMKLAAGTVLGSTQIINPGDVKAWPVWTIEPPADEVTLTDTDADRTIELAGEVTSGQTLTIVTQPRFTDVRLSDGTDYWPTLTGKPSFWPVRPGTTNIELMLTGASTGSAVEVSFNPRYWSAW